MLAPVSWIRELVELPDVTTAELAHRLTALGLKLEAIKQAGGDISGPLVIGRVLTLEPEPQKNGKTINWCTVDVGAANGTGEPQGIVCGAHNFEVGDDVFELLQLRDEVIEFEINPDRAYALSLRGVAREAALALGDVSAFHDPAERTVPAPNADGYPVEVEDAAGCPVFAARTVTGFDPAAPTPTWLARRLHLAGMRSIS